jgi:hypothetical protein
MHNVGSYLGFSSSHKNNLFLNTNHPSEDEKLSELTDLGNIRFISTEGRKPREACLVPFLYCSFNLRFVVFANLIHNCKGPSSVA